MWPELPSDRSMALGFAPFRHNRVLLLWKYAMLSVLLGSTHESSSSSPVPYQVPAARAAADRLQGAPQARSRNLSGGVAIRGNMTFISSPPCAAHS